MADGDLVDAVAVDVIRIDVVAEVVLRAVLGVLPQLVEVLVVGRQRDQPARVREHKQCVRSVRVLVELRHSHAVVVIDVGQRRRGPGHFLDDRAGTAVGQHQPLLAVDLAPVRQLVAPRVMEVPQNSRRFVAPRIVARGRRRIPAPQLVAIVGIHDSGVVIQDIQDRVFSRTIDITEFDDVGRRNRVLVQQLDLGRQLQRLQVVFLEGCVPGQHQHVERGPGMDRCKPHLDLAPALQRVVGAALPSQLALAVDASVFLAVDLDVEGAGGRADAAHKEVIDAGFLHGNLRRNVVGNAQVDGVVVEEPRSGGEAPIVGIAIGNVEIEVRCGNDNSAGRLVRGVVVVQHKRLLRENHCARQGEQKSHGSER